MQIGEKIFRQMKQKTQAILDVLTSIFVRYDGKYSVKMHACDLISGYLDTERAKEIVDSRNSFLESVML